ncbi:MAG: hypothetical protein ACOC3T_06455 [Bacteroidota bacterium]
MEILEILKYTLPSIIVLITAVYIINRFIDSENKKIQTNLVLKNRDIITPLRLQAYERVILFLERISPESMLMRVNKSGMNAHDLQRELLRTIRAEYEHNISQQIYLSSKSWAVIKKAKENLIQIINTSAGKVGSKEPALKLSQIILETIMNETKSPTAIAIEQIKKEVHQLF